MNHQYAPLRASLEDRGSSANSSTVEEDSPDTSYSSIYEKERLRIGSGTVVWSIRRVVGAIAIVLSGVIVSIWILSRNQISADSAIFRVMKGSRIPQRPVWAYQDEHTPTQETCRKFRQRLNTKPMSKSGDCVAKHSRPLIGKEDFFSASQGPVTYRSRFERYTDANLGIRYRSVKSKQEAYEVDELLGPIKPEGVGRSEWILSLKDRNEFINTPLLNNKVELDQIPNWRAMSDGCGIEQSSIKRPKKRTAIVFRFYEGFVMTEDQILDLRAMLSEMVIDRPEDGYDIRILVEDKETIGVLMSQQAQQQALMTMMPREFWGLVEFWSIDSAKLFVPGITGPGSYETRKDCVLAAQLFSHLHPEYDFVYNWEADLRFLGSYRTFFDSIEAFARQEPFSENLEKYKKFYVEGTNSSKITWKIGGSSDRDRGKEADLITLDPFLDTKGSGWMHTKTLYNYGPDVPTRASIVSMVRMSRQLARAMNLATVLNGKSMQCEAWPITVALHSQLKPSKDQTFDSNLARIFKNYLPFKAVYVPHPVYLSKPYTHEKVDAIINDPRYLNDDTFMRESTYLWGSNYLPGVYDDWRHGRGVDACRSAAFVHPVKDVGY